jgi:hypothetical protein
LIGTEPVAKAKYSNGATFCVDGLYVVIVVVFGHGWVRRQRLL